MKKQIIFTSLVLLTVLAGCRKDHDPKDPQYPATLANDWMQMQIRLNPATAGYNSIVADRSFGYAGIVMYESVMPGIPGARSLLTQIGSTGIPTTMSKNKYHWPAAMNAAMAYISRHFFDGGPKTNLQAIDSLENVYKTRFLADASAENIANAERYGVEVATAIGNWSKTDGGHEAHKRLNDPGYTPPTGDGKWTSTPPASAPALLPRWGDNRSFVSNIASLTQPAAPLKYSADAGSDFYKMVNELYTISLSLSREDSTIARFWGDQPGNLNVPAHATNILTQLIQNTGKGLYEAAAAYALHGIACNDASISVMKTKYTHNLLRPISYIRNVMGKATWNAVLPTPPHPEYSAAHAVISAASAVVLAGIFGSNYAFTDHTYDNTYGPRSYKNFDEYAAEAGRARLLAGIHYGPSISTGLLQGQKVGKLVMDIKLR
jgi:hypothetical protein